MIIPHEIQGSGAGIHLDLLDALAAGDHTGDRWMLQAPSKGPFRHRRALRHFLLLDLLHQSQFLIDLFPLVVFADIVREDSAGFILPR